MSKKNTFISFLKLCWKISPSYILLLILNSLVSTGQVLANVILPKFLIDELTGKLRIDSLILYGSLLVIGNVFFALFAQIMKRVMDIKNIYMKEYINLAMGNKIMKVKFSDLEDPHCLDLKERAVFAITNHAVLETMISNLVDMIKNIITLLGLITIMFTLSPVLILLLCITISISLFIQKGFSKYQLAFFQELIPVNRKYVYYINLAYSDKIQKDIRLYGMNDMIIDRITEFNEEITDWFIKYNKRSGLVNSVTNLINDLQAAIAYGYVGIRVLTNYLGPKIGIGSFAMYVSSAVNFTTISNALGRNVLVLIQVLGYLEPFMEFMNLAEEEQKGGTIPFTGTIQTLSFENVSFSYPRSEKNVLENISFTINQGEKISIVGLNGAGKTTIVKLLCRLYEPTSGTIKINGHDIREYEFTSYMKGIAAVFQDFKIFAFTLKENITCKEEEKDEKVLEYTEKVGLKESINKLPKGIHSLFGKAYDEEGIDMSGGEGQKIAIARALYKDAALIILDEPTSALDPLAEAEIYEKFNYLVGDKTAIYISHRMSSSVFCDRILVLDKGHIIDYDTHENLMKNKEGIYYKLFHSQAKNYRN